MSHRKAEFRRLRADQASAVLLHWLALGPEDRYHRFGLRLSDEALLRWSRGLQWASHRWWGAWLPAVAPGDSVLAGVLQLTPTTNPVCCELALSVQAPVRRLGIATGLLRTVLVEALALQQLACHHGHPAVLAMAAPLGLRALRGCDGSLKMFRTDQTVSCNQPPGSGASRGHWLA